MLGCDVISRQTHPDILVVIRVGLDARSLAILAFYIYHDLSLSYISNSSKQFQIVVTVLWGSF